VPRATVENHSGRAEKSMGVPALPSFQASTGTAPSRNRPSPAASRRQPSARQASTLFSKNMHSTNCTEMTCRL
jgi:hypothetical protein